MTQFRLSEYKHQTKLKELTRVIKSDNLLHILVIKKCFSMRLVVRLHKIYTPKFYSYNKTFTSYPNNKRTLVLLYTKQCFEIRTFSGLSRVQQGTKWKKNMKENISKHRNSRQSLFQNINANKAEIEMSLNEI